MRRMSVHISASEIGPFSGGIFFTTCPTLFVTYGLYGFSAMTIIDNHKKAPSWLITIEIGAVSVGGFELTTRSQYVH